jgi:hypothetical protein
MSSFHSFSLSAPTFASSRWPTSLPPSHSGKPSSIFRSLARANPLLFFSPSFNATSADTAIPTDSVHANVTASASAAASVSVAALNQDNDLTAVQAGGIGAAVGIVFTLVLIGAVLAMLSKTGRAAFGKKAQIAQQQPPMVQKKASSEIERLAFTFR